jgi:hypothetical protein
MMMPSLMIQEGNGNPLGHLGIENIPDCTGAMPPESYNDSGKRNPESPELSH